MDLRRPAGWLFLIFALILIGMGLVSPERPRLSSANVNLWTGLALVVFSAVMLALGYRKSA